MVCHDSSMCLLTVAGIHCVYGEHGPRALPLIRTLASDTYRNHAHLDRIITMTLMHSLRIQSAGCAGARRACCQP